MTFQKRSRNLKTNVEATFLKRFCGGWFVDVQLDSKYAFERIQNFWFLAIVLAEIFLLNQLNEHFIDKHCQLYSQIKSK